MRGIAEFLSHLQSLDVQVWVEGDLEAAPDQVRLRCTAPAGTLTSELRQELADRKAELMAFLQDARSPSVQPTDTIQPVAYGTQFPLSFAQQRLWFLYQLTPDHPFYNVPAAIRLTGALDQAALERSFNAIVSRHAALRTTFTTVNGQPVQVIAPEAKIGLSVVDLQSVAVDDRLRMAQQFATAEAQRPFNLATDSLLRVTLLKFHSTESMLLLTMHHIVADGWSLGIFIRELGSFYTAYIHGETPVLPALPIQYTDFACWQRNWLQGHVLEEQLTYWREQLRELLPLHLPSDRPRPAVQTYRGATYPLHISPALTQALTALSQQCGVSLFMTLLAAFQTLLYRYTGQEDIAIGSPIANRHRSELEGLIGFFVNSLVLRSTLSGDLPFRELLEQVRQVALDAYAHQDLPFEKLVEDLDPERDLSRNPLFQVAFALQNAPMQTLELPGLTLEPAPLETSSTRFDLEVHLWEPSHGLRSLWQSQEGLSGFISYSTDLFDRERIQRLVGHFQTLLDGIVANPDAPLSDLPLLTPAERQQILVEWNATTPPERSQEQRSHSLFHHLVEFQVQQSPNTMAVVAEQGSLTYQALNQRADQLAQTLRQMGVRSNQLVGLCVDRSLDMVIGILGILKAGGAYVPLDPQYPSDRLHFMLSDTQVAILLTQSWLAERLPASQAQMLCLDQPQTIHSNPAGSVTPMQSATVYTPVERSPLAPLEKGGDWIGSPPSKGGFRGIGQGFGSSTEIGVHRSLQSGEDAGSSDSLAYVIYTSGSTGTPKGVLLSHRGLCHVVEAQQQVFHPSRQSRILQFSSLSFDASVFEIVLALGSGGTLYIPPQSAQLPGTALVQFLQDHAITHALLTPAVLAVLPVAELPDLKVLITGGEACSSQVVDRWAVNRQFFNAYGPTETTIWATVAELHPGDSPQTIGRPIANTQVYILDAARHPVPIGIPGELYIGGKGLAQGYLNRSELTAEAFIRTEHSVLYKTGDRARYRSDGTIEFLGRADTQIKIRGFRVELGEIETTLQRHPAIQEAIVVASGESSDKRLMAYFSLDRQHFQHTLLPSLQAQQIQHWQTLYDQTYQSDPQSVLQAGAQPFNITGWNSSYTGEPIPGEQMQEWVSDRVQQILALKPQRVLEIGCGTGLLLFQIAPHCQSYVATDFSAVSLDLIRHQLEAHALPQVTLQHRMATDFEGLDPASFDVVILNSIVQYFPSQDYLMQVLERAVEAVAPGGVLFLGDVRSLPLLKAFHTWMRFSQADAGLERSQLQQQIERSHFEEPELAVDPTFFQSLRHRFPRIQRVHIRLARGHHQNEMTQFRYNVLLHIADRSVDENKLSHLYDFPLYDSMGWHDWNRHPITVKEIQNQLQKTTPEQLGILHVANRRVSAAVKTVDWMLNGTAPKTVGRLREGLQNATERAIDPQDWWDLEAVLPYRVEITWSAPADSGDYDVLLIRHGVDTRIDWPIAPMFDLAQLDPARNQYTNQPLQSLFARQLIPDLRRYLRQTLPDYMVPSAFVPLDTFPLTPNGKVNRRALPVLDADSLHASNSSIASQTPTELTLTTIWQDLLRLKQVTRQDNFFELGGHSLLATQMTSRVRDAFGLELPLKSVFEAPTIAQLAPVIDMLRDTTSTMQAPPLVRLDRTAHRHKRSTLSSHAAPLLQDYPAPVTSPLDRSVSLPDNSLTAAWSPLVPLTLGGTKPPFFCVHPMFGVVFPYLELAHHLGVDRRFYGLQPLGLDGKHAPLNRIEAIAAYYVQAIQTVQPQGPYFLGGWSFGGLVAFEMAQQLTQAGQSVALLAILDTPAPMSSQQPAFSESLKFLLGTALWSTLPFLLDYGAIATHRIQPLQSWFSRWQWSAITRLIPEKSRLQLLDESAIGPLLRIVYANSQATYRYVPRAYGDRITLFKASEPLTTGPGASLGWDALAKEIQLHQVPGNHLSLLKQPHVQTLAQQLRPYLS